MKIETPYKLWSMAGDLNYAIAGSIIQTVWIPRWSQLRFEKAQKNGELSPESLKGWYFSSVETYGKSILLKLENFGIGTRYIGCNIGQGLWMVKEELAYTNPWTDFIYLIFMMQHPQGYNYQLIFYDKTHQGKLEIREHIHELETLNRYGPAIDSPHFTVDWLKFVMTHYSYKPPSVKSRLMTPKYFAGITNRMATEICFVANIDPRMRSWDLNDEEIERLYMATLVVFSTFSRQRGYHDHMLFGRKQCPVCDTKTETWKHHNRVTYFCPKCQSRDFKHPKPISVSYVEEILKISRNIDYVKNGVEQYNERQKAQSKSLSSKHPGKSE